jgi:inhibitor of the pro-sigma K processing machinery
MSGIEITALALVGLFLLVAVVRLFRRPLKLALRVVVNGALGLGALWLLNSAAPITGLTLGLNWFNALTVGVLGLPGLGLLLLVKWVLV